MSERTKRIRATIITAAALVALTVGGSVLAKVAGSDSDVREIRLVVRDMTYYADNTPEPNPTIRLRRGEKVRIVLANEDLGYSHNLVSPVLRLSTPLMKHGESRSVEFTVPDVPGTSTYSCEPHAEMMKGTVTID